MYSTLTLGRTTWARLPRKLTMERPNNSACERSSVKAPSGLAFFQLRSRQRFRKHKKTVASLGQAQAPGYPKRQPRRNIAGKTAKRRSEHEPGTKGRAKETEARRALVRRGDVGDISVGG